ncbi:MAG: hypothetical protein ACLFPQ_06765 [Candidatus Woesearchaeota archaeon]
MEKQKLLLHLKEVFEKTKEKLCFESSLKDIDSIFYIKDAVMHSGYISTNFSRQLCQRMVDTYNMWVGYLHGLVVPNPNYIPSYTESDMLTEEDKHEIMHMIDKTVALISTNTLIGLTKDREKEKYFIDECVRYWKEEFSIKASRIIAKLNSSWKERSKKKPENKKEKEDNHIFG